MTGQSPPNHRTDDIRRTIDAISNSRTVKTSVAVGILASSLALLIQSFDPSPSVDLFCDSVVAWCIAVFTIEVSFRLIGQRIEFLGRIGNVAWFLTVGIALFTEFDAILMLRLLPLLKEGLWGYILPRSVAVPMMALWIIACAAAGARSVVFMLGETCSGWVDCFGAAFNLAMI